MARRVIGGCGPTAGRIAVDDQTVRVGINDCRHLSQAYAGDSGCMAQTVTLLRPDLLIDGVKMWADIYRCDTVFSEPEYLDPDPALLEQRKRWPWASDPGGGQPNPDEYPCMFRWHGTAFVTEPMGPNPYEVEHTRHYAVTLTQPGHGDCQPGNPPWAAWLGDGWGCTYRDENDEQHTLQGNGYVVQFYP